MKIGRIVSYGCSFTAGQELGDAEILQIDEDVLDKMKRDAGVLSGANIYKTKEMQNKCDELSLTLSWPSHLAKKINVPCWNRAVLGTSLGDAIYKLTYDLEHGHIKDDDLIIVGITCPTRFSTLIDNGYMRTRMIAYQTPFWPSKDIHEFMIKTWGTDSNLIWEHAKHIKYLDLLSDSLGGRIKMVMTVFSWDHLLQHSYPNHISWMSDIQFKHLMDRDVCFTATYGNTAQDYEDAIHGWGHPKLKFHISFADVVYNMLHERNIIQ